MIYLDKPYVLVSWDDAIRSAILEWRDFSYGDEYRAVLNKIIEIFEEHRGIKFLSDSRRMRAIPQEDQQWLMTDWVPRSLKAGLKHTAIVMPKTVLGTMSLQQLSKRGTGDKRLVSSDETSYFESIEEAKRWLRSLPG